MMNSNSAGPHGPRPLQRVTDFLEQRPLKGMFKRVHRTAVAGSVRSLLADFRLQLRQRAHPLPISPASELAARVAGHLLGEDCTALRPVINATGLLIHDGLGRTPLADRAIERMAATARDYANVDLDLQTGERGRRQEAVNRLVKHLTGAEAALVVNNNAGAVVLALAALAAGREVIVSRGELVELDDGLRIQDLITTSGARLREVGTANRTVLADYERAFCETSAAILRVESGERSVSAGRPSLPELVELARARSVPLVQDMGYGGWAGLPHLRLPAGPDISLSLEQGVDLVLFCGDKRLGGPQSGIIVGSEARIRQLAEHPLARAIRVDKLTLAALAATLELFHDRAAAAREVPLLQLIGTPLENLRQRCERVASQITIGGAIAAVEARESEAHLTGGRLPDERLPSWCVAVTPRGMDASRLAATLRQGTPSVMGGVESKWLVLDLRAVFPRQDADLVAAIRRAK